MVHPELEAVAEQYRADGYEVILQPKPSELPDFLQRHAIDMIARRGDQQVVVEVKRRNDLRSEHQLAYLAGEVNSRPNWRFDLIVANGSPWPDEVMGETTEPDHERIHSMTDTAQRLLEQGEIEASCLVAGSAVEAALRDLAKRYGIALERMTLTYIVNALATEGILTSAEFQSISDAIRIRNAVAHGLDSNELTEDVPRTLIETARTLLNRQMTTSEASS